VIDLGYHPLADTFLFADQLFGPEPRYPLRLALCLACGHVQTEYVVSPEERYQKNDYSYDSSNSPVSVAHFLELAQQVSARLELSSNDLVVDVGSNIGTLLGHFKTCAGTKVLGIEPASNIAKLAVKAGIPTFNEFFNDRAAKEILKSGQPKVITATNVFNHSDDLDGFVRNVKEVLREDGHLVIEVPYLLDLVKKRAFDTIYLEHVNYFGITPLVKYFAKHGMSISHVERQEYMCGTIRVYVKRGNQRSAAVDELVREEAQEKLYEPAIYRRFMEQVRGLKYRLNKQLFDIKAAGGRIVGIGAATKGNTLLNFCRIDSDLIDFITDQSPLKLNKLTPGSHIKILKDEDITPEITHALILPWNICQFLTKKLSHLNVKFIIPQMEDSDDSV
jgi:SAM-dependent methyltransferase